MERLLLREQSSIRETIRLLMSQPTSDSTLFPTPLANPSKRLQEEKRQRRARRMARYQEIRSLHEQGVTARDIARHTGLSRQTVRHFIHSPEYPEMNSRQPRRSKLDPFLDYLGCRWQSGGRNAVTLYREIQEQGYDGGLTLVKDRLRSWRKTGGGNEPAVLQPAVRGSPEAPSLPAQAAPPSNRSILWWLLKPDEFLPEEGSRFVTRLSRISPVVRQARELALWFGRMVRERRAQEFGDWVAAVREERVPLLQGFVEKLLKDRAAVLAAMTMEWSNGQTEGQVNRLKLLKRQMYGRAGFKLLRARVLAVV